MTPAARRFGAACAIGSVLVIAAFVCILCTREGGFFGRTPFGLGGLYDAQARALFHGHWDAGAGAFSIERFHLGGRYYTYFGPWPSVLRMPILLVTSHLDGRLTSLSLVLAIATFLAGTSYLLWLVRALVSGPDPSRRELVATGVFVVLLSCGSSVVFLSGSAWVYDEAILWGTAWATWGLVATITYLRSPSGGALVLATIFTTLATLSRPTSGAIGIVLFASLFVLRAVQVPRRRWWVGFADRLSRAAGQSERAEGRAWPLAVAALVPLVASAGVNFAKFGTLFSVPWDKQDVFRSIPARRAVLAANDNGLTALREVPTNLLQYLRPDGIAFHHAFPYVGFGPRPTNIGGVARDMELSTASLSATTTLLLVLAVLGCLVVFVAPIARRTRLDGARVLRLPLIATAIAFVPTLLLAEVAERYMADLTPLFALAGFVGTYAAAAMVRSRPALRRVGVACAAALLVFNVWTNVALTVVFRDANQAVLSLQR